MMQERDAAAIDVAVTTNKNWMQNSVNLSTLINCFVLSDDAKYYSSTCIMKFRYFQLQALGDDEFL